MSPRRALSFPVAIIATMLVVTACTVPRVSTIPTAEQMKTRVGAEESAAVARSRISGSGNAVTAVGVSDYVAAEVVLARLHLDAKTTLKTLTANEKTQTTVKWVNVGVAAVSTVVASVAADQTANKKTWGEVTTGLGAITTALVAIRDDKDLAGRIATCRSILQTGEKEIDVFEATYSAAQPPASDPAALAKFLSDLFAAAVKMIGDVDALNGTCS
jgi:hypothetical protein